MNKENDIDEILRLSSLLIKENDKQSDNTQRMNRGKGVRINLQAQKIKTKLEGYETMIFEKLKPHIGNDEMLIPFIQECEKIKGGN